MLGNEQRRSSIVQRGRPIQGDFCDVSYEVTTSSRWSMVFVLKAYDFGSNQVEVKRDCLSIKI